MATHDLVIVGSGIVGLAHALAASRRGLRVALVDRDLRPMGASVRNFGMVWPIGQPPGPLLDVALRSREVWLEMSQAAGFWSAACGALHVATEADEAAVLEEFCAAHGGAGYGATMMTGAGAARLCPAVPAGRAVAALRTTMELAVDPREAVRALPGYLGRRGVELVLGRAAAAVEPGVVRLADGGVLRAPRVIVASGPDIRSLFPAVLARHKVTRCKLAMLRTAATGTRLNTHLAGGLTLLHYKAFASCPTLPRLRARFEGSHAEHLALGIHVLMSQNASGHLTIGDSHEYGDEPEPFDAVRVESLIVSYLQTFCTPPTLEVEERWHGVYAKSMVGAAFVADRVDEGVYVVNALGGNGMTLSFGLAERVLTAVLEDGVVSIESGVGVGA